MHEALTSAEMMRTVSYARKEPTCEMLLTHIVNLIAAQANLGGISIKTIIPITYREDAVLREVIRELISQGYQVVVDRTHRINVKQKQFYPLKISWSPYVLGSVFEERRDAQYYNTTASYR